MSKWIIAVPAWGDHAIGLFLRNGLPSILESTKWYGGDYTFFVHTDQPERFSDAVPGHTLITRVCNPGAKYAQMSLCHAEAIAMAKIGERVMMFCADEIISFETIAFCEGRFAAGFDAVAVAALRTLESATPPIGAGAEELLRWSFDNIHPICAQLIYGKGLSGHLGNMLFKRGGNVVFRGFTLGPIAFVKRKETTFQGTPDVDLLASYPREKIHVVTDYSMAVTSTTPDALRFKLLTYPFRPIEALGELRRAKNSGPLHWWALTHRIPIVGQAVDCGDDAFVAAVFNLADEPMSKYTESRGTLV